MQRRNPLCGVDRLLLPCQPVSDSVVLHRIARPLLLVPPVSLHGRANASASRRKEAVSVFTPECSIPGHRVRSLISAQPKARASAWTQRSRAQASHFIHAHEPERRISYAVFCLKKKKQRYIRRGSWKRRKRSPGRATPPDLHGPSRGQGEALARRADLVRREGQGLRDAR